MSKQKMTIERHIKNADDMAAACHYLNKIYNRCFKCFPKTNNIMKSLIRMDPNSPKSFFGKLQYELNEEFHVIALDSDLEKHGEIYTDFTKRFKDNRK